MRAETLELIRKLLEAEVEGSGAALDFARRAWSEQWERHRRAKIGSSLKAIEKRAAELDGEIQALEFRHGNAKNALADFNASTKKKE